MSPPATISKMTRFYPVIEQLPKLLFPFFLVILQLLIRSAAGDNSILFVGPALASAGAGLVVSLTTHKSPCPLIDIPDVLSKYIKNKGYSIEPLSDNPFRITCLCISAALVLAWAFIVKLSLEQVQQVITIGNVVISAQFLLGLICYFIGFGVTVRKGT